MEDFIILGEHKFARTRLRTRERGGAYQVAPNRTKMTIWFENPSQKVRIEGADNVAHALLEIERALEPDDSVWMDW